MENANNRLWTRSYILNNMTCFIINVSYYMLMVIMTDYAVSKLGATLSMAGFATGSFIVGALLARIFMGGRIEQIGLKRSAYLGLGIFILGLVLNFFISNIWLLSTVRIIQGIGFGIGSTTTGAIMAHLVPVARRGEGTSYYAMFVTLATAIGPYAGGAFYNGNLFTDLTISTLLLVVSLVGIRYISVPEIPADNNGKTGGSDSEGRLSKFIEPKALPIAVITLLVSLGFAGILGFVSSYEKELGLTGAGKYFFIVYAAFTLISRPFTGRLFDKLGANVVMYPAFVIFGIGLLLLSITSTGWELLLVAACMGLGFGTYMSCAQAIAIMLSPRNRVGVGTSTFFTFMDLGVGFGPSLMGLVIPSIGFSGLYIALAVIQFVCAGLYLITTGRKLRHKSKGAVTVTSEPALPASSGLVITIAREYGCGGREIGKQIAAQLGIPCYDQQIIEKIVSESDLSTTLVSDEEQRLSPSELYRLYAWYAHSLPGNASIAEQLFDSDCRIINDFALKSPCVIIGRLANMILKDRPDVIRIFVYASDDSEAARVSARDKLSLSEAMEKVKRINRERAAHCEHFTHTRWTDATNYDITINSDLYGINGTAKLLTGIIQEKSKALIPTLEQSLSRK